MDERETSVARKQNKKKRVDIGFIKSLMTIFIFYSLFFESIGSSLVELVHLLDWFVGIAYTIR